MIYLHEGEPKALLRSVNDFGFESHDLVGMPRRLCGRQSDNLVDAAVDHRRVKRLDTPARLAVRKDLDAGDNWLAVSNRTLARIYSAFLVAEDPQRRIEARKAATLMHQVSLVQHILARDDLRKVLIGDEVGLGKTIEAGLLIKQLIDKSPSLRVLYLAPARLVNNVVFEFREKLDINARRWVSGKMSDARIEDDKVVVASINKAVFGDNLQKVADSGPWDVVVIDECHHLSDWGSQGGKPNQSFKLAVQLIKNLPPDGRLILLSGTPHQGSEARFRNILKLLSDDGKDLNGARGKVIFRTKDRVRDWKGAPLFPSREIRKPVVVELGEKYSDWYLEIGGLYETAGLGGVRLRAAGWAKGQALQWAASSVQAGLGFLVRLGMRRLNWTLDVPVLAEALGTLRPYRGGAKDEPLDVLFDRIQRQIGKHQEELAGDPDEEDWEDEVWRPEPEMLERLIKTGIRLIQDNASSPKWNAIYRLIDEANGEKVVLFAQPVETVTVVADLLEKRYGMRPAMIIGNQTDEERTAEVSRFQSDGGPQFLVSSKAGGEGLNMQKARRLIHLDVPWNPMDLEQRIGRVHRFGSKKTVIIDTVVASGSREIDMYRIAREKLLLIARHLEPDQFENLFSRVMSLVPPAELESILVDVRGSSGLDYESANEIGRLVAAGYKSWSEFDNSYRQQAEEIRAANPGEATWADLGTFLVRFAGGKDGAGASFNTFTFADEEIVSVEESLPSIHINGKQFVCGDTGGLPALTSEGHLAQPLGLNIDDVVTALRSSFAPHGQAGVAFLRLSGKHDLDALTSGPFTLFFMLRHRLLNKGGLWEEASVSLNAYLLERGSEFRLLDSATSAKLVRFLSRAQRLKDPSGVAIPDDLELREQELLQSLRRPSDEEMAAGVRYAVWPVGVAFVTP